MFDLTGRVALVTGAGQGVGRGIATALAGRGAKVAINDLFEDRASETAKAITEAGGTAVAAAFDVSDYAAVESGIQSAESNLGGPIDTLVNNAGVPPGMGIGGGLHKGDEKLFEKKLTKEEKKLAAAARKAERLAAKAERASGERASNASEEGGEEAAAAASAAAPPKPAAKPPKGKAAKAEKGGPSKKGAAVPLDELPFFQRTGPAAAKTQHLKRKHVFRNSTRSESFALLQSQNFRKKKSV